MASEIEKMNAVELKEKALELRKRIAQNRFEKATGKIIDTSAPKKMKRELARVLTRQTELSTR